MLKKLLQLFSLDAKALILILIGTISWSLTMVKSGWSYSYGLGFWGPNGHDGVWHMALIESLARGSFDMPTFAGEALKNYHIGFDLLVAVIHKVTTIPVVNLYFQVLPPVFALLIGLLVHLFIWNWRHSRMAAFWSTFFVYFGGSLGWLLGKGESAFWSQQSISTLINPPFALSLVFILLGLICLAKHQRIPDTRYWILGSLCFGILIQIKAYAGILILGGLLAAGIYPTSRNTSSVSSRIRAKRFSFRRDFAPDEALGEDTPGVSPRELHELIANHKSRITKFFIGALVISLALALLVKPSNFPFVLQPFWFLETMMGTPDRLGWDKFYSAMTTYRMGEIWIKAILAYFVAFAIFLVGNLGTRIVGVYGLLTTVYRKTTNHLFGIGIFVIAVIVTGTILPMLFVQKGTSWNTIQFFYYSLFFSGILAGISFGSLIEKIHISMYRYIATSALIVLTVPTTVLTLKDVYLPSRPPAMLSKDELSALSFLRNQADGVVLTYPFDRVKAKEAEANPPRPLYLYESTAYVSAFAKKPVFLEDEINLDITGFDWKRRRAEVENWYREKDQDAATRFLKNKGIKYLYWLKGAPLSESQLGIKKVFENREVDIYETE